MTNREMAIRLAAATIEKMLKFDTNYAEETLRVLRAEIEVFDLVRDLSEGK